VVEVGVLLDENGILIAGSNVSHAMHVDEGSPSKKARTSQEKQGETEKHDDRLFFTKEEMDMCI
jgi:hypothetical protein